MKIENVVICLSVILVEFQRGNQHL